MSEDAEMVNYGVRFPEDMADQIEQYRDRESMSKSEAVRHLVRAGFKQRDRRSQIYERAAVLAIGLLIGAMVVVVAATLAILLAVGSGQLGVVGAQTALVAGLSALGLLGFSAVISWVLYQTGVFAWMDAKFEQFRRALGVRH